MNRYEKPVKSSGTASRPIALLASATLVVATATACTTLDPFTGEERTSRTTSGALIGGAIGAVLGAIAGGDGLKSAAIGAGIGALAGGAVGNYMDRQEAQLRQRLQGTGVSVTRQGDNIILNMPGNVTFDFDSAALRQEFFSVLNSVAVVANEFRQTVLVVDGHTDSVGSRTYNLDLSRRRANTVAQYLQSQGVEPVRIGAYGYGPDYPVASNDTAEGRALNRRVEITLMPITN